MVFLRDNDDLFRLKYIPRTIHRFIGGETCVIHKHVVRRHALFHRVFFHGIDFIVILLPMIPAHQDFFCAAALVNVNRAKHPILQHMAKRILAPYHCAQRDHTICVHLLRFLWLQDIPAGTAHHNPIDNEGG